MSQRKNERMGQRIDRFRDLLPLEGLRPSGAVTLLWKQGFRGTYPKWCKQLNWYDRHGNPMKSMVSRAIRIAKQRGFIPKDATLASYKRSW